MAPTNKEKDYDIDNLLSRLDRLKDIVGDIISENENIKSKIFNTEKLVKPDKNSITRFEPYFHIEAFLLKYIIKCSFCKKELFLPSCQFVDHKKNTLYYE